MVNGSQLFDGCTVFIAVDRAILRGPLMVENGSEGAHCIISSKFEAQHLPNPVAARDGSYLAAPEQPS
jgi:hypothetical protein